MRVLIINGAPRSGKDTFIELLSETGAEVWPYSSIDWVKSKAELLGWDGNKDAVGRKFLSDIKDACTEYRDIPFQQVIKKLNRALQMSIDYFCVNIREPSEIKKLVSYCDGVNIPCYTIRIQNTKAEEAATGLDYTGDSQYMDFDYDFTIPNNSTIGHFRNVIDGLETSINAGAA